MPPLLALAVQGLLSDPNMDPLYLMVGVNRNKFKPSVKAIKELSAASFAGRGERASSGLSLLAGVRVCSRAPTGGCVGLLP